MSSTTKQRLLHKSLHSVPQNTRYLVAGALNQVLFMTGYNLSVYHFEHLHPPSRIYSFFFLFYIPVGHALMSLVVFGWPGRYLPNLLSNVPIGLTAMAIGATLTGYLSRINFNEYVEDSIRANFGIKDNSLDEDDAAGEFYSSIVVSIVTGVWSYVLSVWVNSSKEQEGPPKTGDKEFGKEL